LIFGYDTQTDKFLCAGYLKDGSYGVGHIKAALTPLAIRLYNAAAGNLRVREVCVHPTKLLLDVNGIARQIKDFVDCRPSAGELPKAKECCYGHAVYTVVRKYLVATGDLRLPVNLSITRLFWERVRLMVRRIKLVTQDTPALGNELNSGWESAEKEFKRLHILAVATNSSEHLGNENRSDMIHQYDVATAMDVAMATRTYDALIRLDHVRKGSETLFSDESKTAGM
jgi:hypothetical protein